MSEASQAVVSLIRALPEADREDVLLRCFNDEFLRPVFVNILFSTPASVPRVSPSQAQLKNAKQVLKYELAGELRGTIKTYDIVVRQSAGRQFITYVNGVEHKWLEMAFVEGVLGLFVHRKRNGGNSETHARAIWRHFIDRYNGGDTSVSYAS